jgi:murein DD-endopeptidase MepM/ murein hydrolase activator NlpD
MVSAYSGVGGTLVFALSDLRLPLPGGKHWLLSTEAGTPTTACQSGTGGRFYGGGYDCFHSGGSKYSLDFIDNTQEDGDVTGVPVLAAADGIVSAVVLRPGQDQSCSCFGNYVVVDHSGFTTLYAHLQDGSVAVSSGSVVRQGARLGVMGTSGQSTGIHIHFETRYKNEGAAQSAVLDSAVVDARRIIDYKVGTISDPLYYLSTNAP